MSESATTNNGSAGEEIPDVVHISDEEFSDFKTALRAHHTEYAKKNKGRAVLRAFCVCGYPDSPGPPACRALTKLLR